MIPSGQNELSSSYHFNIIAEVRWTDLESQHEHGKFWWLLFGITRDPSWAVNVSLPGLCDYDVSSGPQIAEFLQQPDPYDQSALCWIKVLFSLNSWENIHGVQEAEKRWIVMKQPRLPHHSTADTHTYRLHFPDHQGMLEAKHSTTRIVCSRHIFLQ